MPPKDGNGERRRQDLKIAKHMGEQTRAVKDMTESLKEIKVSFNDLRKEIKSDFEKVREEMDVKIRHAHGRIDRFKYASYIGGAIAGLIGTGYAIVSIISNYLTTVPGGP